MFRPKKKYLQTNWWLLRLTDGRGDGSQALLCACRHPGLDSFSETGALRVGWTEGSKVPRFPGGNINHASCCFSSAAFAKYSMIRFGKNPYL